MSALPAEYPRIERSFTAVRASLPPGNAAAFDAELMSITQAPVPDLAALDEFLSAWHRIATRAAADPADWQRMNQAADELLSGKRRPGLLLSGIPGEHGASLAQASRAGQLTRSTRITATTSPSTAYMTR
jgi:hypothetical protein